MKKHSFRRLGCLLPALLLLFAACAKQTPPADETTTQAEAAAKPTVLCTLFPLYDWTRQILGALNADVDLRLLMENGADPHAYQATAADRMAATDCELLIYVGGASDGWLEELLPKRGEKPHVRLFDLLRDELREEETAPGMQSDAHEHHESERYDEHLWLSPALAIAACDAIANALEAAFPAHAAEIQKNHAAYLSSLQVLRDQYRGAAENAAIKSILVADRFPFLYLTGELGLTYYAAFEGCSAETAASFETVRFLSEKLKAEQLPCILITESGDPALAQTVATAAGRDDCPVLTLHSMQRLSGKEAGNATYFDLMCENLTVLKTALGYGSPADEAGILD